MRRRDLIAALGGAVATWPLAAHAQQPERMRRIGVLTPFAADDPESMARIAAFLQGLGETGWAVGRNVRIDYRWSAGDAERTRKNAAELVALAPDVILATGSPVTAALLQATRTVPLVFVQVPDPVANGALRQLPRQPPHQHSWETEAAATVTANSLCATCLSNSSHFPGETSAGGSHIRADGCFRKNAHVRARNIETPSAPARSKSCNACRNAALRV